MAKKRKMLGLPPKAEKRLNELYEKAEEWCRTQPNPGPCSEGVANLSVPLEKLPHFTSEDLAITIEFAKLRCAESKNEAACKRGVLTLINEILESDLVELSQEGMSGRKKGRR